MGDFKICFKCHRELLVNKFYKHPGSSDGLRGDCKDCRKKYFADYRIKNISRLRTYNKKWYIGNRDSRIKYAMAYRMKNISKIRAYDRKRGAKNPDGAYRKGYNEWVKKTPGAGRTHQVVYRAILNGKLKKRPCRICGSRRSLAHHDDYLKPLDVIWLCYVHHKARHKKLKKIGKCPSLIIRKEFLHVR